MRVGICVVLVLIAAGVPNVAAQQTPDFPASEYLVYRHSSGPIINPTNTAEIKHQHLVQIPGASWIRLYFSDVVLDKASFIRVTSVLDNETQILDQSSLAQWGQTSAYFNGSAVTVELFADAQSRNNRFTVYQVERELPHEELRGGNGQCGICGSIDDRVPSSETWAGRLLPAGCTASVWNQDSCLVSAGHCIGGNMVIQFNVPNSQSNCNIVNPPVADQFPITSFQFSNNGVGNDWAVMTSGTNNLGQKAFDRFGQMRPISLTPPVPLQTAEMYGYGVDLTCTTSQTQQFASGPITQVLSNHFRYNIDLRGGNSGSSLIRNGEIIGIATHCPCSNYATRIDLAAFAAARTATCGAAPDVVPPSPNPMSFSLLPNPAGTSTVVMQAVTATDANTPPVQYQFDEISGETGGTDSGWQASVDYSDIGLLANTIYTYRCAARDNSVPPNQTGWSATLSATTFIETPGGILVGEVTPTTVELTAIGPFSNLTAGSSGLYFDSTTAGGDGGLNVWQQSLGATASGLQANKEYTFTVKARNRNGIETVVGPSVTVRTKRLFLQVPL